MAFPVKRLKQRNAQEKLRWVTKGIRKSWETFKFLARLCRTSVDEKTKDYFKKYKKVFKSVMRKSKEMCNSKRIEKAVNKGKEIWKIIKEVENISSHRKDVLCKLD